MNWSVGKAASIGFALALAVLVASAGLSYLNIRRVADNEALLAHTHQVLGALRGVLSSLVDAETGQRGYIITGAAPYLEPYEAALDSIRDRLDGLQRLIDDNSRQQQHLAELKRAIDARMRTLRAGVEAREAAGREAGRQFVLSGRGKREMDAVRRVIAGMEQEENDLLAAREEDARGSYQTAIVSLFTTAALGVALVAVGFGLAMREGAARQHAAEIMRRANDDLERRVGERTADLASANESLLRSNQELEQFAAVASHDLQEPLRKIQAFGDRLHAKCAEGLGEQGREYVERMRVSATRMRALIDALLGYSRVTTKAQPFIAVDLALEAANVVSDLEARLRQTGGRVDLGPLPTVEADPLQMRQLLQNLVGNGLKFHKPGEPPVVRVGGRVLNGAAGNGLAPCCEIAVSDNGIGFEEQYLDRIFEVFQRLHGRQEYEGTGMGLAICRKIVERHGGSITARSVPGQGTTFLVTLPMRQPEPSTMKSEA